MHSLENSFQNVMKNPFNRKTKKMSEHIYRQLARLDINELKI